MKMLGYFIIGCGLICGTGCQLVKKDVEGAMPGKYARKMAQKSSVLFDTLIITPISASAHQYLVEQRLVSKKQENGAVLAKSSDKYAAFFNRDKNVLEIPELMSFLSFDGNSLFAGNIQYKKL